VPTSALSCGQCAPVRGNLVSSNVKGSAFRREEQRQPDSSESPKSATWNAVFMLYYLGRDQLLAVITAL
jgi:hypothetical protein